MRIFISWISISSRFKEPAICKPEEQRSCHHLYCYILDYLDVDKGMDDKRRVQMPWQYREILKLSRRRDTRNARDVLKSLIFSELFTRARMMPGIALGIHMVHRLRTCLIRMQ